MSKLQWAYKSSFNKWTWIRVKVYTFDFAGIQHQRFLKVDILIR